MSGASLLGERVWIEDHSICVPDDAVTVGPRIGIDYAGDDVSKPYRFLLSDFDATVPPIAPPDTSREP